MDKKKLIKISLRDYIETPNNWLVDKYILVNYHLFVFYESNYYCVVLERSLDGLKKAFPYETEVNVLVYEKYLKKESPYETKVNIYDDILLSIYGENG